MPMRVRCPRIQGQVRRQSTAAAVIHIPKADIFRFGAGSASTPVFRDVAWTVHENEAWAVVASASHEKHALFQTLLGHLRINPHPPSPGGLFPFLQDQTQDQNQNPISLVSFGHRRAPGGAFYDYTARYGAVHEEDRVTLRQHLFPETVDPFGGIPEELREPGWRDHLARDGHGVEKLTPEQNALFESLVGTMGLGDYLDLPLIALSNGQTRRARILKAIWRQPRLLLLDEPLTGLDVKNRPNLLNLLHELHVAKRPRVILGLRMHDPVPEWITHVALLRGSSVKAGVKDRILSEEAQRVELKSEEESHTPVLAPEIGNVVVDMKNVKVQYEDRKVIQNLTWQIRQGERWHLQGENGSGKTTLLSLLTGDHPQSYTQSPKDAAHLHLFGRPRARTPTPHLQSLIGVLSPEMFDAFPRRAGMSVWAVVGTGFDGTFVPRGRHAVGTGVMQALTDADVAWRVARCEEVIAALAPGSGSGFGEREFVDLGVGEQRMVLLMRALVGRPQLVLLDEVWSGMDEGMVERAKRYMRSGGVNNDQAVVVITHWDGEVPWSDADGVKRIRLEKGEPVFS